MPGPLPLRRVSSMLLGVLGVGMVTYLALTILVPHLDPRSLPATHLGSGETWCNTRWPDNLVSSTSVTNAQALLSPVNDGQYAQFGDGEAVVSFATAIIDTEGPDVRLYFGSSGWNLSSSYYIPLQVFGSMDGTQWTQIAQFTLRRDYLYQDIDLIPAITQIKFLKLVDDSEIAPPGAAYVTIDAIERFHCVQSVNPTGNPNVDRWAAAAEGFYVGTPGFAAGQADGQVATFSEASTLFASFSIPLPNQTGADVRIHLYPQQPGGGPNWERWKVYASEGDQWVYLDTLQVPISAPFVDVDIGTLSAAHYFRLDREQPMTSSLVNGKFDAFEALHVSGTSSASSRASSAGGVSSVGGGMSSAGGASSAPSCGTPSHYAVLVEDTNLSFSAAQQILHAPDGNLMIFYNASDYVVVSFAQNINNQAGPDVRIHASMGGRKFRVLGSTDGSQYTLLATVDSLPTDGKVDIDLRTLPYARFIRLEEAGVNDPSNPTYFDAIEALTCPICVGCFSCIVEETSLPFGGAQPILHAPDGSLMILYNSSDYVVVSFAQDIQNIAGADVRIHVPFGGRKFRVLGSRDGAQYTLLATVDSIPSNGNVDVDLKTLPSARFIKLEEAGVIDPSNPTYFDTIEGFQCAFSPPPSSAASSASSQAAVSSAGGASSAPRSPRCGDGFVDAGEQCGEPGVSCQSGEICTTACRCQTQGQSSAPPPAQSSTPPPPASRSPRCGDGVRDAGEQCGELGLSCPVGSTCTITCRCQTNAASSAPAAARSSAAPATPAAPRCGDAIQQQGEACDGGPGCRANCTLMACGDTIKDPNEGCDDGNTAPDDGCSPRCAVERCGDGVKQSSEQCDDGNRTDTDGCTNACTVPVCGDGKKEAREECDDGNEGDGDGCTKECRSARCGDGIVQEGAEECDDGNKTTTDGCTNECQLPHCGDGIWTVPEECDDGSKNANSPNTCRLRCRKPTCGDGIQDKGEQCDDGNTAPNDGCSAACVREVCGDGVRQGAEQCDDRNRVNHDGCTNGCRFPVCGDGIKQAGEECDAGMANSNGNADACRTTCKKAHCGDGVKDQGEGCDDGNRVSGDGCTALCKQEVCGDGIVQGTEACDDGNTRNGDGCSATCAPELAAAPDVKAQIVTEKPAATSQAAVSSAPVRPAAPPPQPVAVLTCTADWQCSSNLCINGQCYACLRHSDCGAGRICQRGICVIAPLHPPVGETGPAAIALVAAGAAAGYAWVRRRRSR